MDRNFCENSMSKISRRKSPKQQNIYILGNYSFPYWCFLLLFCLERGAASLFFLVLFSTEESQSSSPKLYGIIYLHLKGLHEQELLLTLQKKAIMSPLVLHILFSTSFWKRRSYSTIELLPFTSNRLKKLFSFWSFRKILERGEWLTQRIDSDTKLQMTYNKTIIEIVVNDHFGINP